MKFLEMLDESDLKKLLDRIDAIVVSVFQRHGFKIPHSATSVSHNIMVDQTEKESHQRRMLAISSLVAHAKLASAGLFELGQPANNRDGIRINLDFAIAAVEKEFKQ